MKRCKWIPMTEKQFRARKRKEFKALKKAFDVWRFGCACTPANESQVGIIQKQIDSIFAQCKTWWRKA